MRKFVINVNGNSYEVEVEEVGGSVQTATPVQPVRAPAAPVQAAAPAAPAAAVKPAEAPAKQSAGTEGSVKVNAPMPGTILKIAVKVGDVVKKSQVLLILEAMKMENEIVAPVEGKVASIDVSSGDSVNSGELLVSLE